MSEFLVTTVLALGVAVGDDATAPVRETPVNFRRQVQPLLTKLGCATLSCHGAFRGQAGFRLSLFGRRPREDYDNLMARIDSEEPTESLILEKPTGRVDHKGGQVLAEGSPEYELLVQWIKQGARYSDERPIHLQVDPEKLIVAEGEISEVRVVATWPDGSKGDVTPYVTFSVVDDEVASLKPSGQIVGKKARHSTRLVARYGTTAAHATIIVPESSHLAPRDESPNQSGHIAPRDERPNDSNTDNPIDRIIDERLRELGVEPSTTCSDSEFIRRVMLDLCGRLPESDAVQRFVASTDPAKRRNLIHDLLQSDEYALRWGSWLAQLGGCVPEIDQGIGVAAYHMRIPRDAYSALWVDWFRDRVRRDEPYDRIVAGLLLSTTREGKSFLEYLDWELELRSRVAERRDPGAFYAARNTNDLFWRAYERGDTKPTLLAQSFLGVSLECSKCHDHPLDFWRQSDYRGFAAIFDSATTIRSPRLTKTEKQQVMRWAATYGGLGVFALVGVNVWFIRWRRWLGAGLFAAEMAATAISAYFLLGYGHVLGDEIPTVRSPGLHVTLWLEGLGWAPAVPLGISVVGICIVALTVLCLWCARAASRRRAISTLLVGAAALCFGFGAVTVADAAFTSGQKRTRTPLFNYYRIRWGTFREVIVSKPAASDEQPVAPAKILNGPVIDDAVHADRRAALVDWMRAPDNPYFARNLVNRVWAEYFGRGIVGPPGDMSELNPPTHPELLDWLARDFRDHNYSLRHLHETILTSQAYQRSWVPNESNKDLGDTYARFHPRRMKGQQLIDAVSAATGREIDFGFKGYDEERASAFRLVGLDPSGDRSGPRALRIFCVGQREVNEMRAEGALFLMVDTGLQELIAHPDGRLAKLLARGQPDHMVLRQLYLTCLARTPSDDESQTLLDMLREREDKGTAWHDILWALINTEEFQFVH